MANNYSHLFGWEDRPADVSKVMMGLPMPVFEDVFGNLKGTGRGRVVQLYKYTMQLFKNFVQVQEIGDCTSFMMAHCIDTLKAVEIALKGEMEEFHNVTATEVGYGGSRIIIGRGQLGSGDGSIGAWIAEFINTFGSIDRGKYGDIDLSKYNPSLARKYGSSGVPQAILDLARNHLVKTVSQVSSYEAARDAIANGYPIGVCSNRGFGNVRNSRGILNPSGSWPHAMAILAVDDNPNDPCCLIQNSWPYSWVSGPLRFGNEPPSSFWASADVVDSMLKQGDSFVYSNFQGYEVQDLDWDII